MAASEQYVPVPVFKRSLEELAPILKPIASVSEVGAVYRQLDSDRGAKFAAGLEAAVSIAGLQAEAGSLFSAIFRWALAALGEETPEAFPKEVTLWLWGTGPQRVEYTAAQCRGLLANALVLNVQDTSARLKAESHCGGLDLSELLSRSAGVAPQKVACLLAYFQAQTTWEGTEADQRLVVTERRGKGTPLKAEAMEAALMEFKDWAYQEGHSNICDPTADGLTMHHGTMEPQGDAEEADAFVNFANPMFGYGHFIPSCTQEEIMQVCCPEFNVGMLHQGRMLDLEVVVTEGVARFSSYTGYANTFRYDGPWTVQPSVQTILTMDATTHRHLSREMNLRDLHKAYLCFKGCKMVSTGRWGCGVFGGMPLHKFLQQVVAAKLAGCAMQFSTFGTPELCDQALGLLMEVKPTTTELLEAILQTSNSGPRRAEAFLTTFRVILEKFKAARTAEPPGGKRADLLDV